MSEIWPYVAAIVPTILVATMFYFLIKSMIEGDRRERLAQSRFEAEQDRQRGRTAPSHPSQPSESVVENETIPSVREQEASPRMVERGKSTSGAPAESDPSPGPTSDS